jgi:hypothetical protein
MHEDKPIFAETTEYNLQSLRKRKENLMNFPFKISTLSVLALGCCVLSNIAAIAQTEQSSEALSPEEIQELYYPELVTPSEAEGLTPEQRENLQLEQGDVLDQVPSL